jgi:hypothetical protein
MHRLALLAVPALAAVVAASARFSAFAEDSQAAAACCNIPGNAPQQFKVA